MLQKYFQNFRCILFIRMEINVPRQGNHAYSLTTCVPSSNLWNVQQNVILSATPSNTCMLILLECIINHNYVLVTTNNYDKIIYEYHYTTSCFHHTAP